MWEISRDQRQWSPDSSKIVLRKIDRREVPRLPIVDYLQLHDVVRWTMYPKANDAWAGIETYIADVVNDSLVPVENDGWAYFMNVLGWRKNSGEVMLAQSDRYLRKVKVLVVDTTSGKTRVIHEETSKQGTQGWQRGGPFRMLKDGERFVRKSKKDGRNHFYLHHVDDDRMHRVTEGRFDIQRLVKIDEEAGVVYFTAALDDIWGPRQRKRLYRVNLDGTEQTPLFDFSGESSSISLSPSRKYFLHHHVTNELLPVVDLHAADGTFLQTIATAKVDTSDLLWQPPEEFEFTAADGKTRLTGILYKPFDFDPQKKYPVIDDWYRDGDWVGFVCGGSQGLAQLGFITLHINFADSRADFRYLGKNQIADHVAALTQLAERRPYIDLTRVGIQGGSYYGYHVVHAMLTRPDVFHVGVAAKPITDMAQHFGNDILLGPPDENRDGYEYANNIRLAGNLKGKLLLITGTADTAVPFSHTMKMVDALIRAGKPHDLLVIPGQGHAFDSRSEDYARDVRRHYLQEHLKP